MATGLLICDVQEKFRHAILGFLDVVESTRLLLAVAGALKMPIVISEQNPKALGSTVAEITSALPGTASPYLVVQKMGFSMLAEPAVRSFLREHGITRLIVVGLETHICVRGTVKDALAAGLDVSVVVDGVSSQRALDRRVALDHFTRLPTIRRKSCGIVAEAAEGEASATGAVSGAAAGVASLIAASAGVELTTAEAVVFELLGEATHPAFRPMVALVKERSAAIRAALERSVPAPSGSGIGVLHAVA